MPLSVSVRERVVHRLLRDRTDLGSHDRADLGRRAVRPRGHRPQHGQALGRHLDAVTTKQIGAVNGLPHRSGAL